MLAPFLGSGSTLRGFANRRFTDRNRMLLTGEYRWRPSRYLDMALFMDAGQVAADRRRLRSEANSMSPGASARASTARHSTRCGSKSRTDGRASG